MQVQQTAILVAIDEQLENIGQQVQRLQQKLQQSAKEYKKLELENDSLARVNTAYRDGLIPNYDTVLQLQKQSLEETEAEKLGLEAKIRVVEEKYAQARELLKTQDQKVDGLRAQIQVLSEARLSRDPQPLPAMRKRLRPSKLVKDAPVKRATRRRLEKPTEVESGA